MPTGCVGTMLAPLFGAIAVPRVGTMLVAREGMMGVGRTGSGSRNVRNSSSFSPSMSSSIRATCVGPGAELEGCGVSDEDSVPGVGTGVAELRTAGFELRGLTRGRK